MGDRSETILRAGKSAKILPGGNYLFVMGGGQFVPSREQTNESNHAFLTEVKPLLKGKRSRRRPALDSKRGGFLPAIVPGKVMAVKTQQCSGKGRRKGKNHPASYRWKEKGETIHNQRKRGDGLVPAQYPIVQLGGGRSNR